MSRLSGTRMKTISHSQMDSWQKCRMKWFYRYDANIELPTQSPPLASGKAVHTIVEEALSGNIESNDIIPLASAALEHEFHGREDPQELVDRYLPGVVRAVSRVPKWAYEYRDWKVEEEVGHTYYCDLHIDSSAAPPEANDILNTDDCQVCFRFHGFIDLYRVTEDCIELVDIKSSSKELDPKNLMLFNPQLPYYAVQLRRMYPGLPIFIRYIIVSTAAKTKKETIEHEPWLFPNKLLDKTEKMLIELGREVGALPILPSYSAFACGWCDYSKICTASVLGIKGGEAAAIEEFYVERERD